MTVGNHPVDGTDDIEVAAGTVLVEGAYGYQFHARGDALVLAGGPGVTARENGGDMRAVAARVPEAL